MRQPPRPRQRPRRCPTGGIGEQGLTTRVVGPAWGRRGVGVGVGGRVASGTSVWPAGRRRPTAHGAVPGPRASPTPHTNRGHHQCGPLACGGGLRRASHHPHPPPRVPKPPPRPHTPGPSPRTRCPGGRRQTRLPTPPSPSCPGDGGGGRRDRPSRRAGGHAVGAHRRVGVSGRPPRAWEAGHGSRRSSRWCEGRRRCAWWYVAVAVRHPRWWQLRR